MLPALVNKPPASASVLLVDDTPANLFALSAVLGPLGVRTVEARSGQEALEHIAREPFAVALVDVQMPGMDGFELTARLRATEHGRELPVVFVTAIHRDELFIRRGYAVGAADYIMKPLDPEIVRARVKAFVDLFAQREAVRQGQVAERTQERDEALRRLVALERIATAALETNDLQALLHELLQAFIGAADAADSATILIRDGEHLRVHASVGLGGEVPPDFRIRIGQGFAGAIAAERRAMEISDAAISSRVENPWLRARGTRGLYGVPLLHDGEVLGIAHIGSTHSPSFSEAEKRLLSAAAERAALAIGKQLEHTRLHQVLRSAPAMIAIVNANANMDSVDYSFVNPAYAEVFGADLIGQSFRTRGFGEQALSTLASVISERSTKHLAELRVPAQIRHMNASAPEYVRFTAQPLSNPSGTVDRVLLFAVDMTSEVRARREIEAAQLARAELLEQEREARLAAEAASTAKDEFLATVSHELRTPLNAILGWSVIAQQKTQVDRERALGIIERNARAQARIVEDVLDFSRIAKGKMRLVRSSVQVDEVVRAALDVVRPAMDAKGIKLQLQLANPEPIIADADRLQQVVWNLLANAVKFTPMGGEISVSSDCVMDNVELVVKDSGQGIDRQFLPYVFEAFRQANGSTTRLHGGLGLGLAIVKKIVQAHGGSIAVESDGEGKGTTFILRFPYDRTATTEGRRERRSNAPLSALRLDGLQVLVVDDDDDGRSLLVDALSERGADVLSCASATDALSELTRSRPDVLVSDIAMPDVDGYELIRQVRELSPESGGLTPAVAVTAHARAEAQERAFSAGFQDYLAKPIDIERLVFKVAELGGLLRLRENSSAPF
jgi:signal transduction histidine kinase/PleD family two-component response regulator